MHETEECSSGLGFDRLGHRLFVLAILVPPWGVGILNILGSVHYLFIITICIQGSTECLYFTYLCCLCVSQVACHPAFIKPGIREERTTALQSRMHIRGKLWPQWAHQIHPACPSHIYMNLCDSQMKSYTMGQFGPHGTWSSPTLLEIGDDD